MRLLAFAALAAAFACSSGASAFVVDAPSGGSGDPVADLAQAARWDMNAGSLVATGERGLGGGLARHREADRDYADRNFIRVDWPAVPMAEIIDIVVDSFELDPELDDERFRLPTRPDESE